MGACTDWIGRTGEAVCGKAWLEKSTTYTEIKRLCEKGVLQNEHAVVTPLVTQEEVQAKESDEFVERTFSGSLPGFLTAFLGDKKLSGKEAEELKKLIDEYRED